MSHRNCLSLLVLIAIAGLLAACATPAAPPTAAPAAPAGQPTAAAPARVKVLRLVGGTDWGYPSPFGFNRGPGYTRASYIFDTLVWRDGSGQTIPWLATDWQVSDDKLTWTFTLRDGVKWHDGKPLTVEDVVFSYEYFATTGSGWFLAPLSEAGVTLKPMPMDQASLDAAAKDGNYDMLLVGFGGLGGDPDQLRRNFASTSKTVGFSRARETLHKSTPAAPARPTNRPA
jgi:ABC-type transport system substrate-binding protein